MMPAVATFAESAARASVLTAALRRVHPESEVEARLEAVGAGHLVGAPTLGARPNLVQYRRLRQASRALVRDASPALRRTIAAVEAISPTTAGLETDR